MKKKQKRSKKKKAFKKKIKKSRKIKKTHKKSHKSKTKKKVTKKTKRDKNKINIKNAKRDSFALKLVKFQLSLRPEFNFKINFRLEKYIQGFFDKISETISNYKILKYDEKRRLKLEKIESERKEKIAIEIEKKE